MEVFAKITLLVIASIMWMIAGRLTVDGEEDGQSGFLFSLFAGTIAGIAAAFL